MLARRSWLTYLVTVLILLSAGIDYCTFDVADPSASMSGVVALTGVVLPGAAAAASCLPDDDCLCCGTVVIDRAPPPAPVFPAHFCVEEQSLPAPSADVVAWKRPPRVLLPHA